MLYDIWTETIITAFNIPYTAEKYCHPCYCSVKLSSVKQALYGWDQNALLVVLQLIFYGFSLQYTNMFIKHFKDTTEIISGDRAILRELLNPRKDQVQIEYSLAWALVESGKKTIPHTISYSEVYYILQGAGVMHIDDEHAPVHTQDAIYIPPHAIQWIENTGQEALIFLCIVSPAWHPEAEQILNNDRQYR